MTDLPNTIKDEQMISVSVDSTFFIEIIKRLNQKIKEHEQRFINLDNQIRNFVTKEVFENTVDPLSKKVDDFAKRSQEALEQSEELTQVTNQTRDKLTAMIDGKFDEMLFSTKLNQKTASESLEQKIDTCFLKTKEALDRAREAQEEVRAQNEVTKETKANVQILGDRIHHVNTEFIKYVNSHNRSVKRNNSDEMLQLPGASGDNDLMEQIQQRTAEQINQVQTTMADLLNNRLTSLQKALDIALMHTNSDNAPKLNEVWAVTSQNRAALVNAMTEQSLLSRRVDVLQQLIDNMQNSSNPESPNRPMLSSIMAHQNAATRAGMVMPLDQDIRFKEHTKLVNTVDAIGGKVDGALQDILRIKNAVNRNEKDVRDVVLAIIDEFKLIRTNASGLEHLPPLNLATCVPSFFNNPSFTFDRHNNEYEELDESDRSSALPTAHDTRDRMRRGRRGRYRDDSENEDSVDRISEEETTPKKSTPFFKTKKISGLMHIVSRQPQRTQGPPKPEFQEDKKSVRSEDKASVKSENNNEDSSLVSSSPGRTVVPQSSGEQVVVHMVDKESLTKLQGEMEIFIKNKNELLSAVERKVDRDFVEKVFNKFRVIINGLNERVKEIAAAMDKFATQKDVQTVAEVLSKTAEMVEKSSKTSTKLPVSNFGGQGDFVYGDDGAAFIKESTKKEGSELPLLQKNGKF